MIDSPHGIARTVAEYPGTALSTQPESLDPTPLHELVPMLQVAGATPTEASPWSADIDHTGDAALAVEPVVVLDELPMAASDRPVSESGPLAEVSAIATAMFNPEFVPQLASVDLDMDPVELPVLTPRLDPAGPSSAKTVIESRVLGTPPPAEGFVEPIPLQCEHELEATSAIQRATRTALATIVDTSSTMEVDESVLEDITAVVAVEAEHGQTVAYRAMRQDIVQAALRKLLIPAETASTLPKRVQFAESLLLRTFTAVEPDSTMSVCPLQPAVASLLHFTSLCLHYLWQACQSQVGSPLSFRHFGLGRYDLTSDQKSGLSWNIGHDPAALASARSQVPCPGPFTMPHSFDTEAAFLCDIGRDGADEGEVEGGMIEPLIPATPPPPSDREPAPTARRAFNAHSLLDSFISMRRSGDMVSPSKESASAQVPLSNRVQPTVLQRRGSKRAADPTAPTTQAPAAQRRRAVQVPGEQSGLNSTAHRPVAAHRAQHGYKHQDDLSFSQPPSARALVLCSDRCAVGGHIPRALQVRRAPHLAAPHTWT